MQEKDVLSRIHEAHDEGGFKLRSGTYGDDKYGLGGCAVGALVYGELEMLGANMRFDTIVNRLSLSSDFLDGLDAGFEEAASVIMYRHNAGHREREVAVPLESEKPGYQLGVEVALHYQDEVIERAHTYV